MVTRMLWRAGHLVFAAITGWLLLSGCVQPAKVTVPADFKVPEREIIYVAPFVNTLVPDFISEQVFNNFVDNLNRKSTLPGARFFAIIKDELKDVDPAWLAKQVYISGELWSYIENPGCCSTEMRIKSRISIHRPGQENTLEVFVPKETFFEHDKSSIEAERAKFATQLANELFSQLKKAMPNSK